MFLSLNHLTPKTIQPVPLALTVPAKKQLLSPVTDTVKFSSNEGVKPYPPIKPFKTHDIPVSNLHTIHVEEFGNPNGEPVIVLHGGPGAGTSKDQDPTNFDPDFYRIILLDQRGAGLSTPPGETKENTPKDLLEDLETVRKHLNVKKWALFGGSWGSMLGLLYAQQHPEKVTALILRGIYTNSENEQEWLFDKNGAGRFFPEEWESVVRHIPESERVNTKRMIEAIEKIEDADALKQAKEDGAHYGVSVGSSTLIPKELLLASMQDIFEQFWDVMTHYFKNNFFLPPTYIEEQMKPVQDAKFPVWIIQGRLDLTTPPERAHRLSKMIPRAKFSMVEGAGHRDTIPAIKLKTIEATEEFKALKQKQSQE